MATLDRESRPSYLSAIHLPLTDRDDVGGIVGQGTMHDGHGDG